MSTILHAASAGALTGALSSLAAILAKAQARDDAAALPDERLAPDMFPLSWQVQICCFYAASGTAYLTGRVPSSPHPVFEELDLAGLHRLITVTIETLQALRPEDFTGAETRQIAMQLMPGMALEIDGANFLHLWMLPNFYFHTVTAYDILRHKGLEIGKRDYLAHAAAFIKQTA